jgi:hypothetical protein
LPAESKFVEKIKKHWEIQKNWQLLFPFLGVIVLAYSSYKLSLLFIKDENVLINLLISAILFYILLKLTLLLFNKLENKWKVNYKWEMINIFLVFAITGSSSIFISRPIIKLIGITKENLNPFLYWIFYIIIGFIFYQISLVLIGWLFGQFKFFWTFEKKMLTRLGFKRFLKE